MLHHLPLESFLVGPTVQCRRLPYVGEAIREQAHDTKAFFVHVSNLFMVVCNPSSFARQFFQYGPCVSRGLLHPGHAVQ